MHAPGASKVELIGEVFNMKSASDIEGIHAAGQADIAVVPARRRPRDAQDTPRTGL